MKSRLMLAFLVTVTGVLTAMAPAAAEELTSSVALPFTLSIQGANGRSEVLAPVPEGAVPLQLTGTVNATYNYPGVVSISVAGRDAVEVDATTGGAISIPLTAADVVEGRVPLLMAVRLTAQEECFADDTATAVLADALIDFQYPATPPDTIATFLSAGVQQYTVVVSPSASAQAHGAALTAVAALTRRFPTPTLVELLATDEVPEATYLNRVIVFTEQTLDNDSANTVEVLNGAMSITGEGDGLTQAATALADPNTSVLVQPATSDLSAPADFTLRDGAVSFKDLGVNALELTGIGRQQAQISLTQPMFGQPLESMRVNLTGALTPLPEGGQGRVDLSWNDQVLTSIPMSANPNFTRSLEIPTDLLRRDNSLGIALFYSPPGGACFPPGMPATLEIDTVTSTADAKVGTSVVAGFDRFPQVLEATVPVALDSGMPPDEALAAAGDLVASLQSASPQQYVFEVQSIDDVRRDGRPALIVGATETTSTRFEAPLRDSNPTRIGIGSPTFQAVLVGPFAALQAFSSDDRNLVMLTNVNPTSDGASQLATSLASYANEPPTRWGQLTGQVVAMAVDGEPIATNITQPPPPNESLTVLIATVIGFTVLIVLILFWLWRRPRGAAPPPPGGDALPATGGDAG